MDRAFLHACTPARCAFTLLGNAPAGTLPHTLLRSCLYACALVLAFSLNERGPILAPGSWIIDLTSPDARRHTARRLLALLAVGSWLVWNHNEDESMRLAFACSRCSQPASQAALRPIDNNRFFAGGLTDGLARLQLAQIWLSDASRAIWSALLSLAAVVIHNFSLYMMLPGLCGTIPTCTRTNVLGTGRMETGCSGTSPKLRQKRFGCFPSSEEGSRRSGRNEVESFDRTGYNPNQKTRVAYTNVAQYTPPSFSAPADQPSCQNLPSERAITNEWSGLPASHCCKAARSLQTQHKSFSELTRRTRAGAEQVTRSRLDTLALLSRPIVLFHESEVLA